MDNNFIKPGKVSGNPYAEAERIGGQPLTGFERDNSFLPRSTSASSAKSEILLEGLRDSGMDTSKMSKVGGTTSITAPKPYMPDYADPSRMFYPKTFHEKVRYWKLFLEQDPVTSNLIELYSDMPVSDVKLTGEGVEGEIKDTYETMMDETKILSFFSHIIRSYLGLGEAIVHNYFDSTRGIWSHVICHDPERVQVMSAPLAVTDPFLMLIPDEQTTKLLKSTDPLVQKLKLKIPAEILKWLYTKKGIPLDTSLNCTYIPRKLFPWDVRGTAILSRLWRILMLEDALYNATLQTARRHAFPVKVLLGGNPQTGWVPSPAHEERMMQMLQYAETDPHAWILAHYGWKFEAWGTTDKGWTISRDNEMIERIKLIALGVSKAFITGEVTYSSAEKGLQVFLTRLKHMRVFFEQSWWYPRFFQPIAEMNKWVLPTRAETDHRIKIRRSPRELQEDKRLIIPKLEWEQSLDYKVKRDVLDAYGKLDSIGIKISKSSTMAAVGLDFEEEARKIAREEQQEQEIKKEFGLLEDPEKKILETKEDSFQVEKDIRDEVKRTPVEVEEEPMQKRFSVESKVIQSAIWDAEGKYKGWHYADVEPFISWLREGECIDPFWSRLIYPEEEVKKVATGTNTLMVKARRGDQGYFQVESDNKGLFKLVRSEMGGMSRLQTADYQIGDWVLLESSEGSRIGEIKSIVANYKDEHNMVSKSYVYGDPAWTNIETFLKGEDFLDAEIQAFKEIVVAEGLANSPDKEAVSETQEKLQKLMDDLPDDTALLGDAEIDGLIQKVLGQEKMIGDRVERTVRSVRKKGNGEDFLTGGSSGITPFIKFSDMGILPHE